MVAFKERVEGPLYFAQRRASIWFALVTYYQASDRLRPTWQMNLFSEPIPPFPLRSAPCGRRAWPPIEAPVGYMGLKGGLKKLD